LAKEEKKIEISLDKRRYGKMMTIVSNVSKDMRPNEILKKLKQNLACGGTYKNGKIELQGNHIKRIKNLLVKLGFKEDQIKTK